VDYNAKFWCNRENEEGRITAVVKGPRPTQLLARLQPRHPHPDAGQGGVCEAAVNEPTELEVSHRSSKGWLLLLYPLVNGARVRSRIEAQTN
jgi:hypothetical protein